MDNMNLLYFQPPDNLIQAILDSLMKKSSMEEMLVLGDWLETLPSDGSGVQVEKLLTFYWTAFANAYPQKWAKMLEMMQPYL